MGNDDVGNIRDKTIEEFSQTLNSIDDTVAWSQIPCQ